MGWAALACMHKQQTHYTHALGDGLQNAVLVVGVPVAVEVPAVGASRSSGSRRHDGKCAAVVTMMMILGWWERTQEEALGDLFVLVLKLNGFIETCARMEGNQPTRRLARSITAPGAALHPFYLAEHGGEEQ